MSAWRRSGAAVRLLAVLCVTAGCAATQQQQQQPSAASSTEVLDLVAQAVRAELRPLLSKLESRMDALDSKLESRMNALDSTLQSAVSTMALLGSRVDALDNRLVQCDSRLEEAISRLDQVKETTKPRPRDCSELSAGATTGIHSIWPGPGRLQSPTKVFCDMDTDGGNWTVFQRRDDVQPRQDFFLGWKAYKNGFGNLTEEFWWGLKYLHQLTAAQDRQYELRIDLEDFDGNTAFAVYQDFRISSEEDGYTLSAFNYRGNAGNSLSYQVNSKFSTRDLDQDSASGGSCAERRQGAWWHSACGYSNLNGRYLERGAEDEDGIWWATWKGSSESLKKTELKIRPTQISHRVQN